MSRTLSITDLGLTRPAEKEENSVIDIEGEQPETNQGATAHLIHTVVFPLSLLSLVILFSPLITFPPTQIQLLIESCIAE